MKDNTLIEIKRIVPSMLSIEYIPVFKDKTVLVGDYSDFSFIHTNAVLTSLGFNVFRAFSGEEIVNKIKNNYTYDLIITNNLYKGMLDGPDVVKLLKAMPDFEIPVVVLTVSLNENNIFINEYEFDAYLNKPLVQGELITAVNKLLFL